MARDIDEIWVNSYNPEITEAFDANTDVQVVIDFYAIITYVTEYFVKDDSSGVVSQLFNSLKENEDVDLKGKMKMLMNCWIRNRVMGQAEAVYRLVKDFQFRDSDAVCVFAHTGPRNERSKMLKNTMEKPEY